MKILLGADPEVFVGNNGKFVSGHNMIIGSKEDPFPVNFGAVQVDGMALEFNIDPADSEEKFVFNIEEVFKQLKAMLPEGHDFLKESFVEFDEEFLNAQPKEARQLGCAPFFNAYDDYGVRCEATLNRAAGGHIHIGWTEGKDEMDPNHISLCRDVAKQLDYFVGAPSVLMDKDNRRKSSYGKAGSFRTKHYGMEYRVLSNYWLFSKERIRNVYNNVMAGINCLISDYEVFEDADLASSAPSPLIISDVINNGDEGLARYVVDRLGLEVVT